MNSNAHAVERSDAELAPKVSPATTTSRGRNRLPPAKTLQRIALCTFEGASVSGGTIVLSSRSIRGRITGANSLTLFSVVVGDFESVVMLQAQNLLRRSWIRPKG